MNSKSEDEEWIDLKLTDFQKYVVQLRDISTNRMGKLDGTVKKAIERSLNEAEVAIRHLQQNINIPEINLEINPQIQEIVDKARSENRKALASDLGDLVQDSNFLNNLQSGVNRWITEIKKITTFERELNSGTAIQETTFWLNLEQALIRLNNIRNSDEVVLTLEALKMGKRFHATVSFDTDTELKSKLELAQKYNKVMREIPLNDLMSAPDFESISEALVKIFSVLKNLRNSEYPVKRSLDFLSVLSSDTCDQVIRIIRSRPLLHIPFAEFKEIMKKANDLFTYLGDETQTIWSLLRTVTKQQKFDFKFTFINSRHKILENRFKELANFRDKHEQLSSVINRVLRFSSGVALDNGMQASPDKQVAKAYNNVKEVDYLDISVEGINNWEAVLARYKEEISRTEMQLAVRLREQLGGAKNAEEMFTIFSRFNVLFVRPHIRSAIREFQTQLIERVKSDIEDLQERFNDEENIKLAIRVGNSFDIPELSAKMMWIRQIESQLNVNMKRVVDVLGEQWENHVEGKELKKVSDILRQKLDTNYMFNEWSLKVLAKCRIPMNKLFSVERLQKDGKIVYRLKVNYTPESIVIAKEVRNMKNMGFRIQFKLMSVVQSASSTYPNAISLLESIRVYEATNEIVFARKGVYKLVSGYRKIIHEYLLEGNVVWDNYKIDSYAIKIADAMNNYQEKVGELIEILDKIDVEITALDTCQYKQAVFAQILGSIQKSVDQLVHNDYSNLKWWINTLDKTIETKLARRVEEAIYIWTKMLNREELDEEQELKCAPIILKSRLEIRISSQGINVVPSLDKARQQLLTQFFSWHGIVTSQHRIQLNRQGMEVQTYRSVLLKMQHKQKVLVDVFNAVEKVMKTVGDYVNQWTKYQALWDLQSDMLNERLGNDLEKYMKVLVEIKKSRNMVDTQDTELELFPFVVDYNKVQTKVSVKYDYWQREVLQKFGNTLGVFMQKFFVEISKWRSDLESQSVDSSNTSDTVALITYVQSLKKKTKSYQEIVDRFVAGEKLAKSNRYQFPKAWLFAEHIVGEWTALLQILERKDAGIQSQVSNLQTRILEEDKILEKHINDVITEWNRQKPIQGTQRPKDALILLGNFSDKFEKLKEDLDNVVKAKNALEIADSIALTGRQTTARLEIFVEELNDLIGVWKALLPVYDAIDEMKERSWLSIQPRKIRQTLDEQLERLKQLPSQYRSYQSYDHAKYLLTNYSKMNMLVIELKSDALKERHWKKLMKELHVDWILSELTLGQVWDANLARYENVIKEILLVAQGELINENFLKQVKDHWANYEVELVNYQQKTKLIRGWDDIFSKLKNHMDDLVAMKMTSYYKQFEEEALALEERLNKINTLFDVWIDVQRRWVYLEGLFTGSADISNLLREESNWFNNVSTEFLGLMKKVTQAPRILDIINIQGAQRILERLADLLAKIQKALGEYLERERSSFPRFYFVGDEDLLEILGNSKDISRLQKHFKKMFAGVMTIEYDEQNKLIKSISSREGEVVQLKKFVDLKEVPKVNDWLRKLEYEIQSSLTKYLGESLTSFSQFDINSLSQTSFMEWLDNYPAQIVCLCCDVWWTSVLENNLLKNSNANQALFFVEKLISVLSESVLNDQPLIRRKKIESLITDFVHKRDVSRKIINMNISSSTDFSWLEVMRYYFKENEANPLKSCLIKMSDGQFYYGFEYLGIQEKLVQTPLTDRCYLTMTLALNFRLGGSPFGPAGTGKTESVKALGHNLGRFVLVFNCDETFDFQAVGRILVGLCQVGAWGCFDEFNRLEQRMLSAVSQQIQCIQETLKGGDDTKVDLVGKTLSVNKNMAIFITMNPGYSGRSDLPDNLKQLFRPLAMTQPDKNLIAEVMLFSRGFQTAEVLAKKIVLLFNLCKEQLSNQCHYDFGLRALKYVLVSAGSIKRDGNNLSEQQMLYQSVYETIMPKLVSEDLVLFKLLLSNVFPDVVYEAKQMQNLKEELVKVCDQLLLCHSDNPNEKGYLWFLKLLQLYQITNLNHGLMLVGSSGSGKTKAWKVLLKALENLEKTEAVAHIIDAKAMSKDALYGSMDANTREWTDGLFTHIIRKIIDNVRGEADKRQWIIFDGDVDPEWVENLNSVLDDNKLLTLPNGERLSLLPNIRIVFEVSDLKYATPATVSRCGMVWFSEDVVTTEMVLEHYLLSLNKISLTGDYKVNNRPGELSKSNSIKSGGGNSDNKVLSRGLQIQQQCAQAISSYFTKDGLVAATLNYSMENIEHIMEPLKQRLLFVFFSMMNYSVKQLIEYDSNHEDFPFSIEKIENYITRSMLLNLIWSLSGDSKAKYRKYLSDFIRNSTAISGPPNDAIPLIDYNITITGEWELWMSKVPQIEIEAHRVAANDVVIPTLDTVRHELLLNTWLSERKPLILCGPPGSGKTMTLLSALRSLPDMDVINVNFSSSTTPELLLKNFDHYCEYRRTPNGVVLAPVQITRWLVIFCDEINLPSADKYGTQRVISFMRQLIEQNGFYRTSDRAWVSLERIQFVGACNPPTDPGRYPMTSRFLRHVPVIYVDYLGELSLKQIYGTFNRAMLRPMTLLRSMSDFLTDAMVDFFMQSQEHFTQDEQPHYVYSPRELTRWVRGISEAISPLDSPTPEALIRLWAHEALRLFHDRLVTDTERQWTEELVDSIAQKYFSSYNLTEALKRPLLYSCWLTRHYMPVSREELLNYVQARLRGFYEEELDVKIALYDEMLDHILRIDRIYRQPQGHLLLIGVSGSGKTTLSRFVAWLNGLSVFQLKVHSNYTAADFDEDIRQVLRRAGCKNEKICFIMDESNMLDTGFLERLNTLLANGEVPGLFEGDEYTTLLNQIKEGAQRLGKMLDSSDELYKWFTTQIVRNLHVVFTMNPSGEGLRDRASTSPALFNRCVLNWFGDWSNSALFQVGMELTEQLDLTKSDYIPPGNFEQVCTLPSQNITYHHAVITTFVNVHNVMRKINENEARKGHRVMALTPRHFLDFIKHYSNLFREKRQDLEDERIHLNIGLSKIRETQEQVSELQKSLQQKQIELTEKKEAANAKLKQMLSDQQEAEKEKKASENLQKELRTQLEEIALTKSKVGEELAQVEPTVEEAKNAVKGIKKNQLVELRSMNSPPNAVKLALESICLLLGETSGTDWKAIRAVIIRDDFISRILTFDTDTVSVEIKSAMEKYENNPDWEFDKANRASLACGPLVKWMKAQLAYARILSKVDPLRRELQNLEDDAKAKTAKGEELKVVIEEFEKRIASYKEEYAQLIGQSESIKADLENVKKKVNRSTQLLQSLETEQGRWQVGCNGFSQQMNTLVGDVLLTSAFLAYSGYYDQQMREVIFQKWIGQLQTANIVFRNDIARIEYLSGVDERLEWTNNGISDDNLCLENVIMLHRFNRYPLIIDPSGQSIEYLTKQFPSVQKTSFLDNSFRKTLESALRFGSTLIVQDVENYDPILNPVLNREVKQTGGRILITLGDQDIDFSPSFKIFLFTRDSSVKFPSDVCSRVTFVNFTVTRGSLEMQCLNQILRSECPIVDKKRNDMLKLQGEFAVRLRQLEKALLNALNESKGKILDDDSVIATLEKLKNEAEEILKKSADNEKVKKEVEMESQKYLRFAQACSLIYLTLYNLNDVHFLYNYSMEFLLDIFSNVLESPELGKGDPDARLSIIMSNLFKVTFKRVSNGMLHFDKSLLAILLLRIYLRFGTNEPNYEELFDHLLQRSDLLISEEAFRVMQDQASHLSIPLLNKDQKLSLIKLSRLSDFKDCLEKIQSTNNFAKWFASDKPEINVIPIYNVDNYTTMVKKALNDLLVIHALRPDRLLASVHILINSAFGQDFMQQDNILDLRHVILNEVKSHVPVLLCSAAGYDASGQIEDLAVEIKREITSIAIGSAEGFNQADSALSTASKMGRWLLLKNVHLAPSWLTQLEKKLRDLKPNSQFRLLLTAEIHPKLPTSVIQSSRILIFEPSSGLKANLLRSLSSIPPARFSQTPVERSHLYFLICWFHAVVQERLRYQPLGWANSYEFSDADLRLACEVLDSAISREAAGRTNLHPNKLPWKELKTLLSQCIYGAKIVNVFDQKLLDVFLNKLFKPTYSDDVLIDDIDGKSTKLHTPEKMSRDNLFTWINNINSAQMPNWIGLPNNAEKVFLTIRGKNLLHNVLKVTGEELAYEETSEDGSDTRKNHKSTILADQCQRWLQIIPEKLNRISRTRENIEDPLFRFFEREINLGDALLRDVRRDLNEILAVCKGKNKLNNHVRTLVTSINKGQVPQSWIRYTTPNGITCMEWIKDLSERIKQLIRLTQSQNRRKEEIWLGSLFTPEAYITATRQLVAQTNGWSLEQLHMHIAVFKNQKETENHDHFTLKGLKLVGAICQAKNEIELTDEMQSELGLVQFWWSQDSPSPDAVSLPVYLYANRANALFCVDFVPKKFDAALLSERSVAVICN